MSLYIYLEMPKGHVVYHNNITHNLASMAEAAGIYQHLWHPEGIGVKAAFELIAPLTEGLKKLKADPEHFSQFDAPNKWGMHKHFVPFVEAVLAACVAHPKAVVEACR